MRLDWFSKDCCFDDN